MFNETNNYVIVIYYVIADGYASQSTSKMMQF